MKVNLIQQACHEHTLGSKLKLYTLKALSTELEVDRKVSFHVSYGLYKSVKKSLLDNNLLSN